MDTPRSIVIGVGTEMRGDDGFGAAVIQSLRGRPGFGGQVVLASCDGEPSRMIDLWDGYEHAVVVDAVRGGGERYGYLYRRDLSTDAPSEPRGNSHAAGLGAAVRLAQVLDRLPGRLILYAVHGHDFTLGAPLSQPVAAAVPELAERISRELFAGIFSHGLGTESPGAAAHGLGAGAAAPLADARTSGR
jgi:hydrogenase maturation protease